MATPTMVTINGTLAPFTGAKQVKFRIPNPVRYGAGPDVLLPQTLVANVNQLDGSFTINVPGTNDPAWSPANWSMEITVAGDDLDYQFDAQIPYDASPLDFSDVLPALTPSEGVLYAAFGHTHDDAINPNDYVLVEDFNAANLISYETLQETLAGYLPEITPELVDTTLVIRKADNSAALRLRATGGAVDIDKSAGNIYISSFSAVNFGGAQTNIARLRGNGVTLSGKTEFGSTADLSEMSIDATTGVAALGSKNATPNLKITGYKNTVGAPTTGTWAVDDQIIDSDGIWWRCTAAGTPGSWIGSYNKSLLTTGEEVLPRDDVAGEIALVSGVAYFSFFTARKTETIASIRTATGSTAAAGLTLARIGVYSTDGTTLTLVANTASDTALWNATNTMFPKTFAAPWNKVAGQRYALCYIATGTTMPNLEAVQVRPNSVALAPRILGELAGQTNLPAGPTEASLAIGFRRFQGIFLP